MEFLPFFVLVAAAVIFSAIFDKFHLPWVLALVVSGMFLGKHGIGLLEIDPTISFMGNIGLVLLMFMAGLQVKFSSFKQFSFNVLRFSLINGIIPAMVGFFIGYFLGFGLIVSVLLSAVFMSSAVAVIIPTLEAGGVMKNKLGRTIVPAVIISDIASLLVLSLVLQIEVVNNTLPLPSFYLLLFLILIGFRYALPKIRGLFPVRRDEVDLFESEVRIVIAMLLGTVITFAAIGLHPIVAGFFVGVILSDTINSKILIDKLRTISYGIFIPILFIIIGAETNFIVFWSEPDALLLALILLMGSFGAKLFSGYYAASLGGFNHRDSLIAGASTVPRLSTGLAVVLTAIELQLMPETLMGALVVLSVITTLGAPVFLRYVFDNPELLKNHQ